jgi:hypothetical protein
MPFEEIYAVDLANNTAMTPRIDKFGWKEMKHVDEAPLGQDEHGMTFQTPNKHQGVFVRPPVGSLSIESRILVELTFDLPTQVAGTPLLWAVTVDLANDENLLATAESATASCQFNHRDRPFGVRLNTPSALEKPDAPGLTFVSADLADQAAFLDNPVDFHGNMNLSKYWPTPTLFTLSLSYCGVKAGKLGYTSGNTSLKMEDDGRVPLNLNDHRVYTSLFPIPNNSIGVLGAGVSVGRKSVGTVSARLRTFSVRINVPLPEPTPVVNP